MSEASDDHRLPPVETMVAPPPLVRSVSTSTLSTPVGTGLARPPAKKAPIPVPDLYVVDFASLLSSFDEDDDVVVPAPAESVGQPAPPALTHAVTHDTDVIGIGDEERIRYGELLDRAAERGLLSSTEYQDRLGELAVATTVEEMNRIVTELPVLANPGATVRKAPRSRRPSGKAPSGSTTGGTVAVAPQRRLGLWIVMAVLVVVAVVSLVIVAVSVDRLSRSRTSGLAPTVPTGFVVSPRL